ncbi:MAG: thioredoxin domain-containing protein [Candidatus Hydrothermarchaeaceae archaeon]
MRKTFFVLIFFVIILSGCVDSGSKSLTDAEVEELANQTFKYISDAFLTPQGLSGEHQNIESLGEVYALNFTFGRTGTPTTLTQAYVTSKGLLIMGQAYDTTKPPQTAGQETPPAQTQRTSVSIDGDPCQGSDDAPVTMIEFSDYQCPFCARFWTQTLPQIRKDYIETGKVRFVYRDFPIPVLGHAYATKAAEAAECAGDQGKYWEMHDALFENHGELSSLQKQVNSPEMEDRTIVPVATQGGTFYFDITDDISRIRKFSEDLGLDTVEFNRCIDSGEKLSEIQKDVQDAQSSGVTGTPGFLINGILVSGAQPYATFRQIIESELANNGADSTITGSCGARS